MIRNIKSEKYIEIKLAQEKKHGQEVCGDFFLTFRDGQNTYAVLCDGIGSGTRAHISAVMCAHRILELMKASFDLKVLGHKIAAFMKSARTEENFPFAAFCAATISVDGRFRIVTYENPEPMLAEHTRVSKIIQSYSADSGEVIGICAGVLEVGDTIFMMSDGLTQAGLGRSGGLGWQSEGYLRFSNEVIQQKLGIQKLLDKSIKRVEEMNGGTHIDDVTLVALTARRANVLNILTGPPMNKVDDEKYVNDFINLAGDKIICGSTTTNIFSRVTGKNVESQEFSNTFTSPPKYEIEGIDLVTEGAATLSQAYNIMNMDIDDYKEKNVVTEFCILLKQADTVNFLVGNAKNLGNTGLAFKQLGILPRETIIELISDKLREKGIQVNKKKY